MNLSFHIRARVVELVDTRDLKSLGGNSVPVRVRPRAPNPVIIASYFVTTHPHSSFLHFSSFVICEACPCML